MNKESKNVLPLLTGKSNLNEVPAEELQKLADTYPYFSAAQLLLLQKTKQENATGLQKQILKTALYFPNEQWLRYFLFQSGEDNTEPAVAVIPQEDEIIEETPGDVESDIIEAEPITDTAAIKEEQQTEDINLITLPADQILEDISEPDNIKSEPEEIPLDEDELQQQSDPLPIEESHQKIASLLSGQAEEFHKPVEEKTEVSITTEPFHTVDYFASQGIKLEVKREEDTVFDKKVHKFTDWLRQMKRISPHPVDLGTETEQETVAATIADSSNYTKAVLTESMADVLLKQGKRDKAIEIYQKLSLLNPDKSTYFAALIQKIK